MGCGNSKDDTPSPADSKIKRWDSAAPQANGRVTTVEMSDETFSKAYLDFNRVMKTEAGRERLTVFAASEYSEENMQFFEKVKAFRDTHREKAKGQEDIMLRTDAQNIIDEFLKPGASKALNLPSDLLAPYKDPAAAVEKAGPHMFDKSIRVIYRAIESDTFHRFRKTEQANDLVAQNIGTRRDSCESVKSNMSFFDHNSISDKSEVTDEKSGGAP